MYGPYYSPYLGSMSYGSTLAHTMALGSQARKAEAEAPRRQIPHIWIQTYTVDMGMDMGMDMNMDIDMEIDMDIDIINSNDLQNHKGTPLTYHKPHAKPGKA